MDQQPNSQNVYPDTPVVPPATRQTDDRFKLSVPWKSWEAILVFILSWIGIPVLILLAFRFAAPYDANIQNFITGVRNGDIVASFQLSLLDAVGGLALIAIILRKYRAPWTKLGLRRFNLPRAVFWLVLMFVIFIAATWLSFIIVKMLWPAFNAGQAQVNEFTQASTPSAKNLSFFALVVIPPIIEEILFRGFMFPAFAGRFGILLGAVFSSLLFGLAHLQANVGVYTVVLGLLLCVMYKKTGSIIPGMALHMLNNYIAFAALMNK